MFASHSAPSSGASWIWLSPVSRTRNVFALFRREFTADPGRDKKARLLITADSRYEVFLNGNRLGDGPPRSWKEPWPFDCYEIGSLLRQGKNSLAVRVSHFGRDTFQYLLSAPGLWCELRSGGDLILGTDDRWRVVEEKAVLWPTPRICLQMGWEEVYDAGKEERDAEGRTWTDLHFNDAAWALAKTVPPSHHRLQAHDLPQKTSEWRTPTRMGASQQVQPAPYVWTIDVYESLAPENTTANPVVGEGLLTVFIHSPVRQEAVLGDPHGRTLKAWQLNNQTLVFDDRGFLAAGAPVARGGLEAGWNRLVVRLDSPQMFGRVTLCLWAKDIRFASMPKGDAAEGWLQLGPVRETPAPVFWGGGLQPDAVYPAAADLDRHDLEAWWQERNWRRIDPPGKLVAEEHVCREDVFARTWSDAAVPGFSTPAPNTPSWEDTVNERELLPPAGGDWRLLYDFGDELVGELRLELEASAGTIIDAHCFEFMQADGRLNLTEDVNNGFRYICREGPQVFQSRQRRGFRYLWLVVRGQQAPVRLKSVQVRFSTYPQRHAGAFTSSDGQLNRIWDVSAQSLRCCSEDTYTDCPAYEQTHWIGDARNEAMIDLVINGDPRLSRHCWFQAAQSLDRSPLVESHVPSGWRVLIPTFSWLWLDWAAWHYDYTGDLKTAGEMLPWIARLLDNTRALLSPRGLFEMAAWNLLDWAPMDTPPTGAIMHVNAFLAWGMDRSAWLAEQLGEREKADGWRRQAADLRDAANRLFWDETRQAYADSCDEAGVLSQRASYQTQVTAILTGLATGRRLDACRRQLDQPWTEGRVGSPLVAGLVLQCLIDEGRWPAALERIHAYWGGQLAAGATTFWEMFQPWEPRLTRSHCHGWSGIPSVFFSRESLGVQPLEPGFRSVRIAPKTAGLTWAEGRVPTPDGAISVRWEQNPSSFSIEYTGPADRDYQIEFPAGIDAASLKLPAGTRWLQRGRVVKSSLHELRLHVCRDAVNPSPEAVLCLPK